MCVCVCVRVRVRVRERERDGCYPSSLCLLFPLTSFLLPPPPPPPPPPQDGMLSKPVTSQLGEDDQRKRKNEAFDLLDALTRCGSIPLEGASLHVVLAATHSVRKPIQL